MVSYILPISLKLGVKFQDTLIMQDFADEQLALTWRLADETHYCKLHDGGRLTKGHSLFTKNSSIFSMNLQTVVTGTRRPRGNN